MDAFSNIVKDIWTQRIFDDHQALREKEKSLRFQELPGYQKLEIRVNENRSGISEAILESYDLYVDALEREDYGSVWAFSEIIQDQAIINITAAGVDGSPLWIEAFTQAGQVIGAAISSRGMIVWLETAEVRTHVQSQDLPGTSLPVALRRRRTYNNGLSDEQEAEISACCEKWREFSFSTGPIDRDIATMAINLLYQTAELPENPEIKFYKSPYAAIAPDVLKSKDDIQNHLNEFPDKSLYQLSYQAMLSERFGSPLSVPLLRPLISQFREQIDEQVDKEINRKFVRSLPDPLWGEQSERLAGILISHLSGKVWEDFKSNPQVSWGSIYGSIRKQILSAAIRRESLCLTAASLDVYRSVLGCEIDQDRWLALEKIATSCGWLIPYEKHCIVCDLPIQLSFDNTGQWHASDEPAVLFLDGFCIYANHGKITEITPPPD